MKVTEISKLITGKLTNWFEALIKLLPNIVLAVIVLVLGFYVAKYIRKIAKKIIGRLSNNVTLNNLFSSIVYFIFIGIVIFTALTILKLDKAVTSILAGAGILGLALAFAFQDIAANFMSGIFISFRKPLQVGDVVKLKDFMGKIKQINLRDTVLETFQGETVIIPNKEVFQNPIENYSYFNKRRLDLFVGVSFGDDLEKVQKVTYDAVKDLENRAEDEEITVFFVEFGDSSINLSVRIWLNSPEQIVFVKARSEAIIKIKKAYDANDIMIPFPIRTLDFGIKGGTTLTEMPVTFLNKSEELKD